MCTTNIAQTAYVYKGLSHERYICYIRDLLLQNFRSCWQKLLQRSFFEGIAIWENGHI